MSESMVPPATMSQRVIRAVDWVVLTLLGAVATMAVINLNSAGASDWSGDIVKSQLRWVVVGAVVLGVSASVDYRLYYRVAYPLYAMGVLLLIVAAIQGAVVNQAARWLILPGGEPGSPRTLFQPSEPMKVFMVLAIARYLQDLSAKEQTGTAKGLLVPAALALVPAAFIVKQPDLSTSIVILLIAFSMLAVSELDWRRVLVLLVVGVAAFMVGWRFLMETYQRERVDVWLNPEAYAEGKGYQILQARTAVGNGGFFGRGAGQGTQNVLNFVPYKESDFAFAVFAEEWGFVGSTMLLALLLSLVLWSLNIASQSRDRFSALVCTGVAALVFWHTVLNVGVVLEFFPNTGLPLPFFTHGGSNVVTVMLALGILISVSRSRRWR